MKWVAPLFLALALPVIAGDTGGTNTPEDARRDAAIAPESLVTMNTNSAGQPNTTASPPVVQAPPPPASDARPGIPSTRSTLWFIGGALLALLGMVLASRKRSQPSE